MTTPPTPAPPQHHAETAAHPGGPAPEAPPRLRGLVLHQPWAELMAAGHKSFETRAWRPRKGLAPGGLLVVVAGRQDLPRFLPFPLAELVVSLGLASMLRRTGDPGRTEVYWQPVAQGAAVLVVRFERALPVIEADDVIEAVQMAGKLGLRACLALVDGPQLYRVVGPTAYNVTPELPFGFYEAGRFGWETTVVKRLERPVPVRGHQGLFDLSVEESAAVREQLAVPDTELPTFAPELKAVLRSCTDAELAAYRIRLDPTDPRRGMLDGEWRQDFGPEYPAAEDDVCGLCLGDACEDGCGRGGRRPCTRKHAGPDSHRVCRRCGGSALAAGVPS